MDLSFLTTEQQQSLSFFKFDGEKFCFECFTEELGEDPEDHKPLSKKLAMFYVCNNCGKKFNDLLAELKEENQELDLDFALADIDLAAMEKEAKKVKKQPKALKKELDLVILKSEKEEIKDLKEHISEVDIDVEEDEGE